MRDYFGLNNTNEKENFFSLIQTSLNQEGNRLQVVDGNSNSFQINLAELLSEYNNLSEGIVEEINFKTVETVFALEDKIALELLEDIRFG